MIIPDTFLRWFLEKRSPVRPVFKSCKSHSSRVFFADAGGSHQADMSQETLLVWDFNKGDCGREWMRNATKTGKKWPRGEALSKNIHPKGRAALTASSLCAGGGPAETSRVICQRKISKPMRHPTEEPKKPMQSSTRRTLSSLGSLVCSA